MRTLIVPVTLALASCSSGAGPKEPAVAPNAENSQSSKIPVEVKAETLNEDTPKTTFAGNTFIAPADWSFKVRDNATILEAPEGGSFFALYDISDARDADDAVAQAWAHYAGKPPFPLRSNSTMVDNEGWSESRDYSYNVPPNLHRVLGVNVMLANGQWTAVIYDMDWAILEKRGGQVATLFDRLLPKNYVRESFAGKKAQPLDTQRIGELSKFVADSRNITGVPGIAFGLIQNGQVVYSGGLGVRELGKPAKVDGDTKFMVASNTKALATLMLAKLVDNKQLAWDQPVTSILPSFKLGDLDTTRKVQLKHLVCACTGIPRQDFEWSFEWGQLTPAKVMDTLATMQPTSEFGELFQYSNTLAAAAGFVGGSVVNPKLELGAAFDNAMQSMVFDPLQMNDTSFDFSKGQSGNAAVPHAPNVDGELGLAIAEVNTSVIALRPAGGAWSSVNDMLKYVQMELSEGIGPDGKRYIGKDALLARRAPQVSMGTDHTYGMGLMVDNTSGVTVVHHGGDMIGFHSDMMWLPEYGVGAVILTNGDPGWVIRSEFRRKLLEVLFDGAPKADKRIAPQAQQFTDYMATERKNMTLPAAAEQVANLAQTYTSDALGSVRVINNGGATVFDFGEYSTEVASRINVDGTVSFITTAPGNSGFEFVVGEQDGKRTLVTRDGQHKYVLTEQ